MSNEEQVPVAESNSPVEPGESSKAAGSVDTEQIPKVDDSTEPGKASVEGEQSPKVDGTAEPGKANESGEVKQSPKVDGTTEPAKATESGDGKQSRQESVPSPGPKFAFDMGKDLGGLTQIVGDNASVNISVYVDMVQGKSIKSSDGSTNDGALKTESTETSELISETLKFERKSMTFFTQSESDVGTTKLPETEEEFSQWYYSLGDYERYYVQTAAVLHGAPVHEVTKRADSLYNFIRDQVKRREYTLRFRYHRGDQRETQQRGSPRFSDLFLRKIPSRELLLRTHTITRRVDDMERLYWQDVDPYGLSRFGIQLLAFLTKEFISRGEYGQNSLKVLHDWSNDSSNGEVSWKAAHSYGVVLWCHNADLLGTEAEAWAKVKSRLSWRRTAELLNGAYEIEQIKNDEKVNDVKTLSVVLRLLDSWVDRVHEEFSKQEKKKLNTEDQAKLDQVKAVQAEKDQVKLNEATSLGCAVTSTYGLIGKRSPEIALAGLQRLLQLPQIDSTDDTRSIFAAGVSTYVTLTWSGRVRSVLEHLAANAERLSHQRPLTHKTEELRKYRQYREVHLNATLEAFFLVAIASFLGRREKPPVSYSLTEPLPPQPAIPDPAGRDVLLAGLLSQNEVRLKEHITTLLCTAIIEKRSRLAFSLLRYWADIVFEMLRTQDIDRDAVKKFVSFWRFIVNLGKTVDRWCLDLEKQGFRSPKAIDAFKSRLEQWCKEGRIRSYPIGSLAQEVLKQFGN